MAARSDFSELADGELVGQTLAGEEEAYRELVGRYQGHVYGLAYSLVGDWTEAQDIAQEAFIRAYSNLDQLRDRERFAAWLRRVTFGVAMNWLKAFRPGLFRQLDGKVDLQQLEIPDFQPAPPEAAQKRELADAVLGAVASLPPKYRVPLTMFHLDGLSYQKVADFLDIPLGTVKSIIHRAKEKLRAALPAAIAEEITPVVQETFNEYKLPDGFAGKVIAGLPAERPVGGMWHLDGLPAALRAVLAFEGAEAAYLEDDVFAALTGQAFRFWFAPDWASCLAYTYEDPIGVIVAEALGFDYVWRPTEDIGFDTNEVWEGKRALPQELVDAGWNEMKQQLDAGHPVIVFGGNREADLKAGPCVVTGYDEDSGLVYFLPHSSWVPAAPWDDSDPECQRGIKEQGYRARPRPDETNWIGTGYAPGEGMGGSAVSLFCFRQRKRTPTEHEVVTAILKRAIEIGRSTLFGREPGWRRSGLAALDLLIECLDQEGDTFEHSGMKATWQAIGEGDWWFAMEGLTGPDFRLAAGAFLKRCAGGFGSFTQAQCEALDSAADAYRQGNRHMLAFWELFESTGPLEEYEERMETVGRALSSREFRQRAADVAGDIRQSEAEAIGAMEEVLASEQALG